MNKEVKNRQKQNEFIAMIHRCITAYDEADKLYDEIEEFVKTTMPSETSFYDSEQQDYLHLFEDYDLTDNQLISIGKALVNNRDNRRNWHNIWKIAEVWNNHKNKLINRNTRLFLKDSITKAINNLDLQWKYRKLSEEDITKLLKDTDIEIKNTSNKKKPHNRHMLTDDVIKEVIKLQKEGVSAIKTQQQLGNIGLSTVFKIRQGIYRSV